MSNSASEVAGAGTEPAIANLRGRRPVRPWVLVCLLILTGTVAFAAAKQRGGCFFFYVAREPGGAWVVADKGDRRWDQKRVEISIVASGTLHRHWSLAVLDDHGRPVTDGEYHELAAKAIDRLDRANARLEGIGTHDEYQDTLRALRLTLSSGRDYRIENWPGMLIEKLCFILAPVAAIGLVACGTIAAERARVDARHRRRLASIAKLRCPACKYDLRGVPAPIVCPECGTDVEAVEREARAALD